MEPEGPVVKCKYLAYLKSIPLLANLRDDELDVVGQAATELSLPEGEVLMREGTLAHEMFVVLEGTLEVTRDGEHVADIGAGAFAGEMALLIQARRDATVTTATPARVLHIDGRSFSNLLDDAPHLAVSMLPIVAARLMANSDHHAH